MNALKEIYGGFKSLLIGMRITLGQFFKRAVTVHYPHETLKMPPRYRGHIELVGNPETGQAALFVCKLCERACPSDCISVEGVKFEGDKRKTVTSYKLDFTKCSLCGACVEVCRDGAIRFSRDYNLAGLTEGRVPPGPGPAVPCPAGGGWEIRNPKSEIRTSARARGGGAEAGGPVGRRRQKRRACAMSSFPAANLIVTAIFILCLATMAAGALLAVLTSKLLRSVCGLVICCLGLAGLYYFLTAPFWP